MKLTIYSIPEMQNLFKQHQTIGALLLEGETITRTLVKMKAGFKGWTPVGCAREVKNGYIIARYDRYDFISKDGTIYLKDVEDKAPVI